MKLKFSIYAYDISLYKIFVFLLSLSNYFGCYGNLKFPLTYKAESGNLQFLPFEDIEILFLHKCLLSSPPRFRQLLSNFALFVWLL